MVEESFVAGDKSRWMIAKPGGFGAFGQNRALMMGF
jgi:hypothetical protein